MSNYRDALEYIREIIEISESIENEILVIWKEIDELNLNDNIQQSEIEILRSSLNAIREDDNSLNAYSKKKSKNNLVFIDNKKLIQNNLVTLKKRIIGIKKKNITLTDEEKILIKYFGEII